MASLWVHLGPGDRPAPLPPDFVAAYGEAAAGRTVSARLRHRAGPGPEATARPWPLRSADLDVLAHVNNAATWQAVEDELWRRGVVPAAGRARVPRRARTRATTWCSAPRRAPRELRLWLTVGDEIRASATVVPATR